MGKAKIHISLFFAWVLVFPLVFQLWHSVEHHGLLSESMTSQVQIHSCCSIEHHDMAISETDYQFDLPLSHCPICEYEFAHFDIKASIQLRFFPPAYSDLQIIPPSKRTSNFNGFCRQLRAPPRI